MLKTIITHKRHGISKKNGKVYGVWYGMLRRCYDKKWARYDGWGGRGIGVCSEWHDVKTFYEWAVNNGYKEGLLLDRIDNNADYSPNNCRFVTPRESSNNTRCSIRIKAFGKIMPVPMWSEKTGISNNTIHTWVKRHGKKVAGERIEKRMAGM